MTFARRRINLKFQLGEGSFGESGFDTIELEGLRVQANITQGNAVSNASLNLRAFGLPFDVMNKLTILKQDLLAKSSKRLNFITVLAGDEGSLLSPVFYGGISETWADFNNIPDASLIVVAQTGLVDMLRPVAPTSYRGSVDAALIMSSLAALMGAGFENSGVSVQLRDPYYPGTALDQARAVARAGDFNAVLDSNRNVLAIWPKSGARGDQAVLISRETGMVGYPAYTQNGVSIQTQFNPNISIGGQINVESALTPATGLWTPYLIEHDLESEMPQGRWFTRAEANLFGSERPLVS